MDGGLNDTEIVQLLESFSAPIVSVGGPAGSGKTRLLARFSLVVFVVVELYRHASMRVYGNECVTTRNVLYT